MTESMTYGRYLALDQLLAAQHPLSDRHDELLFIIIHQTKELWLKQMIAELRAALDLVRADKPVEAYKSLARVSRIQAVMTLSWDVLATMTPSDYTRFREVLGTSSGFQSDQFRAVETMLGLRGGGVPGPLTTQVAALPSLWDEANAALARAGGEKDIAVYLIANENAVPFYEKLGMKKADDVMQYNHIEWTEFTVE